MDQIPGRKERNFGWLYYFCNNSGIEGGGMNEKNENTYTFTENTYVWTRRRQLEIRIVGQVLSKNSIWHCVSRLEVSYFERKLELSYYTKETVSMVLLYVHFGL